MPCNGLEMKFQSLLAWVCLCMLFIGDSYLIELSNQMNFLKIEKCSLHEYLYVNFDRNFCIYDIFSISWISSYSL